MAKILTNLGGKARRTTLGGRACTAVGVVMLTPGVRVGSDGALLYDARMLRQHNAADWNGGVITANHPVIGGRPVSARTPEAWDYRIGTVFHAGVSENAFLHGVAYLDDSDCDRAAPGLLNKVWGGQRIEVSTGLWPKVDRAPEGATFNGVGYHGIVRSFSVDHLAVLLHERGACPVSEGCGLNANAAAEPGGLVVGQVARNATCACTDCVARWLAKKLRAHEGEKARAGLSPVPDFRPEAAPASRVYVDDSDNVLPTFASRW